MDIKMDSETTKIADGSDRLDELVGSERQRLKQMETNTHWLINQIDAIHFALCPNQNGTWQQRAEQSVEAARAIASNDQNQSEGATK